MPTADAREHSELVRYLEWLRRDRALDFAGYDELWQWSVDELAAFWASLWDFFEIKAHEPYERVLDLARASGSRVVPGCASQLRRAHARARRGRGHGWRSSPFHRHANRSSSRSPSCASRSRGRGPACSGWASSRGTASSRYLPNIPETIVAFLATASLGAVWATCPPEFGVRSVLASARPALTDGPAGRRRLPLRRQARRPAR